MEIARVHGNHCLLFRRGMKKAQVAATLVVLDEPGFQKNLDDLPGLTVGSLLTQVAAAQPGHRGRGSPALSLAGALSQILGEWPGLLVPPLLDDGQVQKVLP